MRLSAFLSIAFLSALGLILMLSFTYNKYEWMSEVLESSENLPIDEKSTFKLGLISITGLLVCFSNVCVLRKSTSAFQKSIAVIMILGAGIAFYMFFDGGLNCVPSWKN